MKRISAIAVGLMSFILISLVSSSAPSLEIDRQADGSDSRKDDSTTIFTKVADDHGDLEKQNQSTSTSRSSACTKHALLASRTWNDLSEVEDNNEYWQANPLFDFSNEFLFGHRDDYAATISGTIYGTAQNASQSDDIDYFYFEVFGDAEVNISLTNIPFQKDYDITLYSTCGYRFSSMWDFSDLEPIKVGDLINQQAESIQCPLLTAGRYFISVYAKREVNNYHQNYDADHPYSLFLRVSYAALSNASISDLRYNKGAKAALWLSDYEPWGVEPYSNMGQFSVPYNSETFEALYDGNVLAYGSVATSVLYIWDTDFRTDLRSKLIAIRDLVQTDIDIDRAIEKTIEKYTKLVNGVCVVTGIVLSFCTLGVAESDATSVVTSFAPMVFEAILKAILKESWTVDYLLVVRSYLNLLISVLECTNGAPESEVVKLSSYYGVLDACETADFSLHDGDSFLYQSDVIPAFQDTSLVGGKIYPLFDSPVTPDSSLEAFDFDQWMTSGASFLTSSGLPDINTGGDTVLSEIDLFLGTTIKGKYSWYHFTAPTSSRYRFALSDNAGQSMAETFPNIVNGQSEVGLISSWTGAPLSTSPFFYHDMLAGSTIYIRVRGNNWTEETAYALSVEAVSHSHVYTDHYRSISSTQHRAYCWCGEYEIQSHRFTDHYVYLNANSHKAYCVCGSYVLKPHAVREGSTYIRNGRTYGVCVDCGALLDLTSGVVVASKVTVSSEI